MFSWFKRLVEPPAPPPRRKPRSSSSSRKPARTPDHFESRPAPIPGVVAEGNSESDWSEWESSMMELDSQMGELAPSSQVYEREGKNRYTRPAPLVDDTNDAKDTFGNVTKNRDL
jgi:hypothetical protein